MNFSERNLAKINKPKGNNYEQINLEIQDDLVERYSASLNSFKSLLEENRQLSDRNKFIPDFIFVGLDFENFYGKLLNNINKITMEKQGSGSIRNLKLSWPPIWNNIPNKFEGWDTKIEINEEEDAKYQYLFYLENIIATMDLTVNFFRDRQRVHLLNQSRIKARYIEKLDSLVGNYVKQYLMDKKLLAASIMLALAQKDGEITQRL
ncbi:MAG: hypothetical protein AAGF07_01625 [Patescibacteria group bacterium]